MTDEEFIIIAFIFLLWVTICGVVGYAIGKSKNRASEGVILGMFLGLIGIIIVLFMKDGAPPKQTTSTGGSVQGWHPDPYGRHEFRYFDGLNWRNDVSDKGAVGYDDPNQPPPAPAPEPVHTPEIEPSNPNYKRDGDKWLFWDGTKWVPHDQGPPPSVDTARVSGEPPTNNS